MEIRIKEQYHSMIPVLSSEEYQELKKSIQENGVHLPIVVNEQGEILDGHNRYRICRELGIEPPIEVKSFDTVEDEEIFVLEANLTRRQLTPAQRIALIHEKLEPLAKERARKRQLSALSEGSGAPIPSVSRDTNEDTSSDSDEHIEESGRTREVMAEKAGVSPATYSRGVIVLEEADKEVKDAMMSGEMSVGEAYRAVRPEPERKHKEKELELPSDLFDALTHEIAESRESGINTIQLVHDGRKVTGIRPIELAS